MSKVTGFLKQYPEIPFVILAYLVPYAFLVAPVPSGPLYTILLVVGSWTPNLAAIAVLTLIMREGGGVKKLFSGWRKWRVAPIWYLVALAPIPIAFVCGSVYLDYLGGAAPSPAVPLIPSIMGMLALAIAAGPTGEELGWRGFLLPRLQSRMPALAASLLVGAIWGLWHLPLFFIPGLTWSAIPVWSFMLTALSTSIIAARIMNSTGGSTLMSTLLHLSLNFGPILVDMLGIMPVHECHKYAAAIYALVAVGTVLVGDTDLLTRETRKPATAIR